MNILKEIHKIEINKLNIKYDTNFKTGEIISIDILIDKKKKRLQNIIGLVISKKNKGINSTFIIKKKIGSLYIKRSFFLYSPIIKNIKKISIIKKNKSKLYYM